MHKDELIKIVLNHFNSKQLSINEKKKVYKLIKKFIVDDDISNMSFNIIKKKKYKDIKIDLNILSEKQLIDLLSESGFSN